MKKLILLFILLLFVAGCKQPINVGNPIPEIRLFTMNIKNPEFISLGEFKITYYCDCRICQGKWVGTTATGVKPTINHTIAVDPQVIELGTHVWIDGIEYVAEDVGGNIKGKRIDIFVSNHHLANELGVDYKDVKIKFELKDFRKE